jgi:hypothetical protein
VKIAVKFYQKTFTASEGEKSNDVYNRLNTWLARNIIKKVEMGETFWKVEHVKADSPTFTLELWTMLDAEEGTKGFCERCREFHSSFFLNQQYNCDACNYIAFKKQMDQKLNIKKAWRKEKLGHIINDTE